MGIRLALRRRAALHGVATLAERKVKKRTVRDLSDAELRGKRVLLRVDFNVPLDESGEITDDTRIRAALPTIRLLLERGGRPVILSHLGRPKGKPELKYSLQPVSNRLMELMRCKVIFVESTDSDEALKASQDLNPGEILLLENTRFLGGEEKNDQRLARALAASPEILMLDEPAAGLNPRETGEIDEVIRRIVDRGIAVLLVEHDMKLVMAISGRIVVLDHGKCIADGPPQQVRADPGVIRAYLGAEGP